MDYLFNYKAIVDDDELIYEFKKSPSIEGPASYLAVSKETGEPSEFLIRLNGCTFECEDDTIFTQFKLWQTRPERKLGRKVPVGGVNMEELICTYEELLFGAFIACSNFKITRAVVNNRYGSAIEWLRTTDFYSAPASTRYHDSYPGGLLVHTLNVYNRMIDLIKSDVFKSVDLAQATLAVLVHDWCKIGTYEPYKRNVKNEQTNQWEQVTEYRKSLKGVTLGHGVTSMFMLSRFIVLQPETALAIRWHQGRWNVCEAEQDEFQLACESYPIVLLVQFADQLSITSYNTL